MRMNSITLANFVNLQSNFGTTQTMCLRKKFDVFIYAWILLVLINFVHRLTPNRNFSSLVSIAH